MRVLKYTKVHTLQQYPLLFLDLFLCQTVAFKYIDFKESHFYVAIDKSKGSEHSEQDLVVGHP